MPGRLVPCVCGTVPPQEGGLHDRWSHCTDSCHGEAASLLIGCAVDQQSPVVCFICLSGLLRRLQLAMIDRHLSLLHAKENICRDPGRSYIPKG